MITPFLSAIEHFLFNIQLDHENHKSGIPMKQGAYAKHGDRVSTTESTAKLLLDISGSSIIINLSGPVKP